MQCCARACKHNQLRNFHKAQSDGQVLYKAMNDLKSFKSWIPEVLQQLVDACATRRFVRGSFIYNAGQKIQNMYIVIDGEAASMSDNKKK